MREPQRVLAYGSHPDQVVDLWPGDPGAPTVVLVHGGYWRSKYDRSLMAPLAEVLLAQGIGCANVEYRRGQEAAWPAPRDDVRDAFRAVRDAVGSSPLTGIGHSVGGQLVLLNAADLDRVVALAPVTDVARTYSEGLGSGAAQEYFHASPSEAPETYSEASALHMDPFPSASTLVVQGHADDAVPASHSLDYLAHRSRTGRPVDAVFRTDLDHMQCIDPHHPVWDQIRPWLG